MSMDLTLIDGYGINLTDLNWKQESEIEAILVELNKYEYMDEHIENELHSRLEFYSVNGNQYIYAPTILPSETEMEYSKIWSREELANEIFKVIGHFIQDDVYVVCSKIHHVFDWELC